MHFYKLLQTFSWIVAYLNLFMKSMAKTNKYFEKKIPNLGTSYLTINF
jgi:hypothetical protein